MSTPSVKDLFVLGRLAGGPTYGHEINATLQLSQARRWVDFSEKHVYYVLKKLEREGLVTSRKTAGRGQGRRVYELTGQGREALVALLGELEFARSIPYSDFDTVAAMLAYTDILPDERKTAILKRRLAEIDRRLLDEYGPLLGRHVQRRFGAAARTLYDKGRMVTQAERAWLIGLIDEVTREGWGKFMPRDR